MMRKSLLIVFVVSLLVLTGCGNDEYAVEKRYWQAKKQAEKVFNNPTATPPSELEKVVKSFTVLTQRYPKTKVALDAEFTIARLYLVTQEFDNARTQLRMILNKYNKVSSICAEAMFLIGNSFQLQDKWGTALEQYKKIMQEYPVSLKGLDVPIYIAQYYKIKYQPEKMRDAYKAAIAHYTALAQKYANTPLSYIVDKLSAQCYVALKDWQEAIDSYRAMAKTYKGKVEMSDILMDTALIYYRELKDVEQAKQALEELLKDYPKSRLAKAAASLLKQMEKK
jgi:TolA-binding protein